MRPRCARSPSCFVVSLSFVVRLLQLHRRTGSLDPKPSAGGRPAALGPDDLERLKELVRQQPDATLKELRQRLGRLVQPHGHLSVPWRSSGSRARRRSVAPDERDRPETQEKRRDFCARLAGVDPHRLVFVDASGANTAMTRRYGRAPAGQRVYASTPGRWESVTLTCGLRLAGVTAAFAFPGATNTGTFEEYVERVLVPELEPGDVIIWDNLKPHKAEEVVEAVEAAGARVIPLPPWSPDLSPIEEMISKTKNALRSAGKRTKQAVSEAIVSALHDVTPEDIARWFQDRAAYAMDRGAALGSLAVDHTVRALQD